MWCFGAASIEPQQRLDGAAFQEKYIWILDLVHLNPFVIIYLLYYHLIKMDW